jgi:hypothetical protein
LEKEDAFIVHMDNGTFKALIKMNAIRNCPVMTEDVSIVKIFGADMMSLAEPNHN